MVPLLPPPLVTRRFESEAGSATVELAAAIPLLVAVTLAMVAILGLARDQVLAQGAAREAAREAAIGGDQTRASAAARAALPRGRAAKVTVATTNLDQVRVSVALPVTLPFGVQPVTVSATAVAAREPGPPPAPTDHGPEPGPPPIPADHEAGPGPDGTVR